MVTVSHRTPPTGRGCAPLGARWETTGNLRPIRYAYGAVLLSETGSTRRGEAAWRMGQHGRDSDSTPAWAGHLSAAPSCPSSHEQTAPAQETSRTEGQSD